MTKKFFTKDRISHFDIFDRHADEAIQQMRMRLKAGYAIDFQVHSTKYPRTLHADIPRKDVMGRFTLDSATEFLFGSCVHSLSAGLSYPHNAMPPDSFSHRNNSAEEFAQAFLLAQRLISERERMGSVWPLFEIFKSKTDEPMKIVNAYLEPIIKEAVEKQRKAPISEKPSAELDDDETVLDHLVKLTSGPFSCLYRILLKSTGIFQCTDPVLLKDETLNIMIAGRDTVSYHIRRLQFLVAC